MKYLVSNLFLLVLFLLTSQAILAQDTIHVETGWNMIGAKSTMQQSGYISEPSEIITSSYYGYKPGVGYSQADTLKEAKGYWVKASQSGILVGGTSSEGSCSAVEYGGKTYQVALIGTQCWFMQSLDIGTMVNGTEEQTNDSTIEKYCYANLASSCTTYGGLYQWNEAMQYSTTAGAQGICPSGWHIPTIDEMQTLSATVSADGNALKGVGQGTGAGVGSNTSGFSGLLSGYRSTDFGSNDLGDYGYIWSSIENVPNAFFLGLSVNDSHIGFDGIGVTKSYGFSVRCLKNN